MFRRLRKLLALIRWKITSGSKASEDVATLGVMPDYGFKGKGMRMSSISSGKTAEKYEFQKDDVVTKLGDYDVKDLMEYMSVLAKYKVGDQVDVTFLRGESEMKATIQFM